MKNRSPLIVILGPTASGKTGLAIALARKWNGYIISADSRQIYRHMDIGTAKPTREQLEAVHHEMIDIADPDSVFSLAQYQGQVFDILERDTTRIPFLVGGTGLYIDAVVGNWDIPKVAPNEVLREALEQLSLEALQERLEKSDPDAVANIDTKNKRRLIRAIEVAETIGTEVVPAEKERSLPYRVLKLGINIPREELNKRIDLRVDQMMKDGLLNEVKTLAEKYDWNLPSMSSLGYRQLGEYLNRTLTLEQAVERIKIETHQYAKRQMTWFQRDKDIHWITQEQEAEKYLRSFLEKEE